MSHVLGTRSHDFTRAGTCTATTHCTHRPLEDDASRRVCPPAGKLFIQVSLTDHSDSDSRIADSLPLAIARLFSISCNRQCSLGNHFNCYSTIRQLLLLDLARKQAVKASIMISLIPQRRMHPLPILKTSQPSHCLCRSQEASWYIANDKFLRPLPRESSLSHSLDFSPTRSQMLASRSVRDVTGASDNHGGDRETIRCAALATSFYHARV
jgi:hypothetical protein